MTANKIIYDLDAMKNLCRALGNPQDKLRIVHIAGTNGKGSVGAFLQSILTYAGYKTGRFASPAVFSPMEILSIDGKEISVKEYNACMEEVNNAYKPEKGRAPTEFEKETAAAFLWFLEKKCDIVLMEAGMGGEYDATNIADKKELCIITPVSMDHMSYLGDDIGEIARSKAGIIKSGCECVSAKQEYEAEYEIEKRCREKNVPLKFAGECVIHDDGSFDYGEFKGIKPSLKGAYQPNNGALAAEAALALKKMGYNIGRKAIYTGIENAVWHGRFEVICREPLFIIDGAHNTDGIRALACSLDKYKDRKKTFIIGVFADKEYDKMMSMIADKAEYIYTITPPSPRGLCAEKLAHTISKYNKNVCAADLDTAVKSAFERGNMIAAFGTLSVLKDIKERAEKWKERTE